MDCPVKVSLIIEGACGMSQLAGTYTITIAPAATALTLTPPSGPLTNGTVGAALDDVVTVVSGGMPPYNFSITNGAIPDGLSLSSEVNPDNSETVSLSGTPTTAGDSSFELTVTDSAATPASVKATVKRKIGK